jgi:hypothetical protein
MKNETPIVIPDQNSPVDTGTPSLPDEDLEDVAGGGIVKDAYDVLQESWTDIKQGFSDAFTD